MTEHFDSKSCLMARLTISALERVVKDSFCWKEPTVYRALLVSGLSVLVASTQLLKADLDER